MSSHPKHPCPDCGAPCDDRAKRCIACHLDAKRLPANRCIDCGATISRQAKRCMDCSGIARRARRIQGSGYVQIWWPGHPLARSDGYVFEHRLVAYEAGIDVPPGFHVHHRNGDKTDNRIENLEVIDIAEHARLHMQERGWVKNQYGTFPLRRRTAA